MLELPFRCQSCRFAASNLYIDARAAVSLLELPFRCQSYRFAASRLYIAASRLRFAARAAVSLPASSI
jgi:hypothetical protein